MVGPRVIVVGAGPAGTRCAETLVAAGIRPTLIDENRRDGGQIYRRQPDNFKRSYATLYGTEATRAESQHRSFDALREHIDYLPDTLVWNISERRVFVLHESRLSELPFDALVLCTGATDRLMPIKGWNFAGTYSLGGAQVALKAQACSIGRQVVFIGTGPLLYLVAAQYLKAGASVAAVLDTSPWSLRLAALPKLLALPRALVNGVALTLALRRAGVPMYSGVEPLEISGTGEGGVDGLSFKDANGEIRSVACDAVAMGYHLRPETQLADLARCEFHFDTATRQWLPRIDPQGRSSVSCVYLAGDGARILGANAAEVSGLLAATALLQDFKQPVDEDMLGEQRRVLSRLERFAQGLRQSFPWPAHLAACLPDEAVVCRCEAVTAGDLRHIVARTGAVEANRVKAFGRVGMGRCQGRYCANAAAEIVAHAANVPLEQVGRLRGQAPVKPLPMGAEADAS